MTDEHWLDVAPEEGDEAYRHGGWQVQQLVRTAEYLGCIFVRSADQIEAQREWLTVCGGNPSDLRRLEQGTLVSRGQDTACEGTDSVTNLQSRRRST